MPAASDRRELRPSTDTDIASLFSQRGSDRHALHGRYVNGQMVRMLKTLGYDVDFRSGKGQYLYDCDGTRYLDLLSGFGVFAIGRNHPALRDALKTVLDGEFPNLIQMGVSALAGTLAERLIARAPYLDKAYFANSGSEAAEAAIKFAKAATGRPGVIYCEDAFHGLSYGALSLNGDEVYRERFEPFLPGCIRIPFNDLAALEQALRTRMVAAFIVEPIQGKGVHLPADDYLATAAALCRRYGTLFIADEVQTGMGRTGRFLAVEHWNVEPDVVLLAKTLSGGHVPVAAVLMRKSIFDNVFDRMDRAMVHASTFGSNDLAMAAGIVTLDVLDSEGLVENAARLGERVIRALAALVPRHEFLHDVRGKGLMIGLEFGSPKSIKLKASWSVLEASRRGLFCQLITIPLFKEHKILAQVAGDGSHTIKLLPAMVISETDCDWIVSAFDSVIAESHRVPGAIWSFGMTMLGHATRSTT
jgi:ornithine--oxo-acid transaminase